MKKRFYPRTVMFYVSEEMKETLSNIPNVSEFIRTAITEKLSTINSQKGDKLNEEVKRDTE